MRARSSFWQWLRRASGQRDVFLTVLGALAGWGISHIYYLRAIDDMKADADERRRVAELVFRGIEAVGNLKYARDATGKVIGVVVELRSQATGRIRATGSLSVISPSGEVK